MKKSFFAILALAALVPAAQAQIIYAADFTSTVIIDHTTSGNAIESSPQAGPNWDIQYFTTPNSDSTRNWFGSNDASNPSELSQQDFGGNAFWNSSLIDVSTWNEISIAGVGATFGTDVFNNVATEFFQWSYSLIPDSGTPVGVFGPLLQSDGSLNTPAAWSTIDTTGFNTLTVAFTFNQDGADDGFSIESVTITGITPIPEPTALALLGAASLALFVIRRRRTA